MMKHSITKNSVYICPIALCFLIKPKSSVFSAISNAANIIPHMTKFQSAPCQRPVSIHTVAMFKSARGLFTRLPPRGIYT